VKIFQALSGNTESGYFSKPVMDVFVKQTNNTSYVEEDIEREMIDQVVEAYDLVLDDPMPAASGMVALVFFARSKSDPDKRYVLKTKRRNIRERIRTGHAEFVGIYNVIRRISKISPKMRDTVNSLRSLADTRDYILTQCEFDEEINALRCTKKEYASIMDDIAVPEVYNDESVALCGGYSHTDYILMEHFEGVGIAELETDAERENVFFSLCKYAGANMYANMTYVHTDMHPGNIICMKRDGRLVVGLIDFGMNLEMDTNLRGLTMGMYGSVAEKLRHPDKRVDALRRCPMLFDPHMDDEFYDSMTESQYWTVNDAFLDTMVGLTEGDFDENKMHSAMREINRVIDNGKRYILSPATFKLLMGQSMIFSCALITVPDPKIRGKLNKKAMRWATTEL
jgi:predicted unusual protein kinase regulating ubiquinone biosynthesis (AarF/ABC1/UbiB family)